MMKPNQKTRHRSQSFSGSRMERSTRRAAGCRLSRSDMDEPQPSTSHSMPPTTHHHLLQMKSFSMHAVHQLSQAADSSKASVRNWLHVPLVVISASTGPQSRTIIRGPELLDMGTAGRIYCGGATTFTSCEMQQIWKRSIMVACWRRGCWDYRQPAQLLHSHLPHQPWQQQPDQQRQGISRLPVQHQSTSQQPGQHLGASRQTRTAGWCTVCSFCAWQRLIKSWDLEKPACPNFGFIKLQSYWYSVLC